MKLLERTAGGGLYLITDGARPDFIDAAAQALAGGARMLQYRDLTRNAQRRHAEASRLRLLCSAHQVPLIIDHDVALAKAVQADGVHVGQDDDDLAAIRAELGGSAIIGVSCYGVLERAQRFAREGADYVSFGAFHPSPTKPQARCVSSDLLRQTAALGVARVAIGGITPDNGGDLVQAGADYLAAVSAIFGAADAEATARRFTQLFQSDTEKTP